MCAWGWHVYAFVHVCVVGGTCVWCVVVVVMCMCVCVHQFMGTCMHHWSKKHMKQETLNTLTNFWRIQAELQHCLASPYSGVCRVLLYSFIFHPFCFCSHSLSWKGCDVCTCVVPIHCACTFHIHRPVRIPVPYNDSFSLYIAVSHMAHVLVYYTLLVVIIICIMFVKLRKYWKRSEFGYTRE